MADGLELSVRVTPRAAQPGLRRVDTDPDGAAVLAVHVAAPPADGAANAALVKLLAKLFGVPKSAVTIAAGQTGRRKRILVAGDPDALAARAADLVAAL
ncbi:DUF167 domain-containing protein [Oceanomicrobium pacificus]|uniref:UPF0235 protein GSH16_01265 n=1 Tax=Oceanomicrobium pacificus TaxID=2692916 RepID=A0A6B0TQL2_9RHOB|nr:DUF167 domain-containing protein [Oceanomicrobium pacificus]MXU64058.1 hypothetical protein [Oceanomicrobium pacificus]